MTTGRRLTSRILLFDESGRILLFLTKAPDTSGVARWITPGGGVDAGESHGAAAERELFEETGLVGVPLGEPVWSHDFEVTWNAADHDTGHAEYYHAVTVNFEPSNENWTPEEHLDVFESRWWSLTELRESNEPFEPVELLELLDLHKPEPGE